VTTRDQVVEGVDVAEDESSVSVTASDGEREMVVVTESVSDAVTDGDGVRVWLEVTESESEVVSDGDGTMERVTDSSSV
jgi:hypothetical protein